jgi:hypothetical protein
MALVDLLRTNRPPQQVVPFDQHLRDMRRVLLNCDNTDVMIYPTDDEQKAALVNGISTVITDAGFEVVDVHLVDRGRELAMGVVVSHKSGMITLEDCQDRINSLDLIITYRDVSSYKAERCCELMRRYFDAEGILLS